MQKGGSSEDARDLDSFHLNLRFCVSAQWPIDSTRGERVKLIKKATPQLHPKHTTLEIL